MRAVLPVVLSVCLALLNLGCGGDGAKGKYSGKDMPKPASSEKQDK
jgi:hypothetical protein